jgi:hypothetical protein
MIKKLILLVAAMALFVNVSQAITTTLTILPGTYTNLLSVTNGTLKITQIVLTAPGTTNVSALFVDAPTNSLLYTTPAFTNRLSYATNYITIWTNYYNVTNATTNIALIDVTNNVAAATNNWPQRLSAAALAGTSTIYSGVNYYFLFGCWVTNTTVGSYETVTVTYQQ